MKHILIVISLVLFTFSTQAADQVVLGFNTQLVVIKAFLTSNTKLAKNVNKSELKNNRRSIKSDLQYLLAGKLGGNSSVALRCYKIAGETNSNLENYRCSLINYGEYGEGDDMTEHSSIIQGNVKINRKTKEIIISDIDSMIAG